MQAILVARTKMDTDTFLVASKQITGLEHARETDKICFSSTVAEDVAVLDHFCGRSIGDAVTYLGFLIGGRPLAVDKVVESLPGMTHVSCEPGADQMLRGTVVSGSVFHWSQAVMKWCSDSKNPEVCSAMSDVYRAMCGLGFRQSFSGTTSRDNSDGTILLLPR